MTTNIDFGGRMAGWFLRQTLVKKGMARPKVITKRLGRNAIRGIVKFYDPTIKILVGQRKIKAPLSHGLPILQSENIHYDRALPRIALAMANAKGKLTMIDVGANIGDTVTMVDQAVHGDFLCIEPSLRYFDLLCENTSSVDGVVAERVAVGDIAKTVRMVVSEDHGTAVLSRGGSEMEVSTVDRVTDLHPRFKKTNLMKIDTDGFDYRVIRGSSKLLTSAKPAIFFELSEPHLRSVTGDEPMSIFPFLADHGYAHVLIYDSDGIPIVPAQIAATETLRGILEWAIRRGYGYLDVLAMHRDDKVLFDLIVIGEYAATKPRR